MVGVKKEKERENGGSVLGDNWMGRRPVAKLSQEEDNPSWPGAGTRLGCLRVNKEAVGSNRIFGDFYPLLHVRLSRAQSDPSKSNKEVDSVWHVADDIATWLHRAYDKGGGCGHTP